MKLIVFWIRLWSLWIVLGLWVIMGCCLGWLILFEIKKLIFLFLFIWGLVVLCKMVFRGVNCMCRLFFFVCFIDCRILWYLLVCLLIRLMFFFRLVWLFSLLFSLLEISLIVVNGVLSLWVVVVIMLLRLVNFCLWVRVIWVVSRVLVILCILFVICCVYELRNIILIISEI